MVNKYIVTVVDDLDDSTPATTVHFSFDGIDYEIDLSDANVTQLRTDFGAVPAGSPHRRPLRRAVDSVA